MSVNSGPKLAFLNIFNAWDIAQSLKSFALIPASKQTLSFSTDNKLKIYRYSKYPQILLKGPKFYPFSSRIEETHTIIVCG